MSLKPLFRSLLKLFVIAVNCKIIILTIFLLEIASSESTVSPLSLKKDI